MSVLTGAVTIGLITSLLAIGVYISFRVFNFVDVTADGSFALGGAIAAALLAANVDPVPATLVSLAGGLIAGTFTGILHTRFNIRPILAGILVMTALYSVNLRVMGRSNIPLLYDTTLITFIEGLSVKVAGDRPAIPILGVSIRAADTGVLIAALILAGLSGWLLSWFFSTHLGAAMRATGNNPAMARALGVNTNRMIVLGIAMSNGLIAVSGAIMAQYQGFADIQMGIGMFVWGIASLIIGETIIGRQGVGRVIIGAIAGSILFRILVSMALSWGMNPNDLKLITAVFVVMALVAPMFIKKIRREPTLPDA